LTGPDGLQKQLSKAVIETALNEEMTEYVGRNLNWFAGDPYSRSGCPGIGVPAAVWLTRCLVRRDT
jgi:hypothetical protein